MKIRVGFVINYTLNKWLGISYYYENLFKTIIDQNDNKIEIVILTDEHITEEETKKFEGIEIIKSKLFDRKSSRWKNYFNIFLILLFGKNFLVEKFLLNNNIKIVSHTSILGRNSKVPSIKFIPDFQELHYPEYFNWKMILKRKMTVWFAAMNSNKVILYSESIKKDMDKIFRTKNEKISYLPYCTNISDDFNLLSFNELKNKFNLQSSYFYLPNHFWKHKNHITVYKALDYINKNFNKKIYLITTGEKSDYRNPGYNNELEKYILNNDLDENIKHLGIVSMNEVYSLIKHSKALINPSFFEGWGTSVEHARYFKKNVIASNIPIHLEQNKFNLNQKINSEHSIKFCHYFEPKDYIQLANLILKISNFEEVETEQSRLMYLAGHKKIVNNFYINYLNIINTII